MNYKIISVESRKGGVGKTTAALNLSDLLVEKGYKVLLLDIDITGTSIEGSYNSSFWKERINPIKQGSEEANLLKIFHDSFLKGEGIHSFFLKKDNNNPVNDISDFVVVENRINVFNSEIYSSNSSGLICDPRILFDELHSFWFVEMIVQLCNSFAGCFGDTEKTVIILDNSPGYVGLGKAIHDWLTDVGEEHGKFLTIASLDAQDMNSCLSAIRTIEDMVNQKNKGAEYYYKLLGKINCDFDELSRDSKKYFLNLASNEDSNRRYLYDKTGVVKSQELDVYQSLIINKVPLDIKSGALCLDISKLLKNDQKKKDIFGLFSKGQNGILKNVVYYDNYVHFQFIEPFIKKVRRDRCDVKREFSSLKGYFTKIENYVVEFQEGDDECSYSQFLNTIDGYENRLFKLLNRLSESGYDNIVQLIEEKWHPKFQLIKTQQFFENLCENLPIFENYSNKHNHKESDFDEEYFQKEIKRIVQEVRILTKKGRITNAVYQSEKNRLSLESLCFFLLKPYLKRFHLNNKEESFSFVRALLLSIITVLNNNFKIERDGRNEKSFQSYLTNASITPHEIMKYRSMINDIVSNGKIGGKLLIEAYFLYSTDVSDTLLASLYNSFCHTLARLIDVHDDFKFLITVLRSVTIGNDNEGAAIFPNIRDVLNDVIIRKEVSHSDGIKRMDKAFQGAQYMLEFRKVLIENVLSKWNL